MTFKTWILMFKSVNLDIGDLAKDVSSDANFPDTKDKEVILSYLESNGASQQSIRTFENCWEFYSKFYIW